MTKSVTPAFIRANGLWNPFTERKTFRITCGECDEDFRETVYFDRKDMVRVTCTNCGTDNRFSLAAFAEHYEAHLRIEADRCAFQDKLIKDRRQARRAAFFHRLIRPFTRLLAWRES